MLLKLTFNLFVTLLLLVWFPPLNYAQISKAETNWLKNYIKEYHIYNGFSGTVLVANGDSITFETVEGWSSLHPKKSNTLVTKFNLGSGGKMFTAVAIAQLKEKGMLDYDDPIDKYLPNIINEDFASEVTIRHLLTHTSGIGDYWDEEYEKHRNDIQTLNDKLPFIENTKIEFNPGEKFLYSNSGYVILGLIIEAVSGKSYFEYVRENIFTPLHMENTSFTKKDGSNDFAIAYQGNNEDWYEALGFDKGSSDGGAYSTIYDMLKFSRGLEKGKILMKETFNEMYDYKLLPNAAKESQYGYGFQTINKNNRIRIGHGGRSYGVYFNYAYFPEYDISIIFFSNSESGYADVLSEKIIEFIMSSNNIREEIMKENPTKNLEGKFFDVRLVEKGNTVNDGVKVLAEKEDDLETEQYWKIINTIFEGIYNNDFKKFNSYNDETGVALLASQESLFDFMVNGAIPKHGKVRDFHSLSPPMVTPDSELPMRSAIFHLKSGISGTINFVLKPNGRIENLSLFIHRQICPNSGKSACPLSLIKTD